MKKGKLYAKVRDRSFEALKVFILDIAGGLSGGKITKLSLPEERLRKALKDYWANSKT